MNEGTNERMNEQMNEYIKLNYLSCYSKHLSYIALYLGRTVMQNLNCMVQIVMTLNRLPMLKRYLLINNQN